MRELDGMKELRKFIKELKSLEYDSVAIGEVFSEEDVECLEVDKLMDRIKQIGIKEVVAIYYESFEFIANDGKYIEINGAW